MTAVVSLLTQDGRLLLRNAIFWVVSATLVAIVLTVHLVIPAEPSDARGDLALVGFSDAPAGATVLDSREALEEHVRRSGAIGVVRDDDGLTVVHAGLSEQAAAAVAVLLTPPVGPLLAVETELLRPRAGFVPQNLRAAPLFIVFEALVLGFMMASVLMLAEKGEGVLRAYRVSPGGTLAYVGSKTLLFTGLGTLYAVLLAVATVGVGFDLPRFLLLAALASALYTLLGLCLTVFFRDLTGWFLVAIVVLGLNMVPMVSFAAPGFAPAWVSAIPAYGILFAFEEILFPTGKDLTGHLLTLTAMVGAGFALCAALVGRRLLAAGA
jgi:fluoroquinolone transport system permease protein